MKTMTRISMWTFVALELLLLVTPPHGPFIDTFTAICVAITIRLAVQCEVKQ